MFSQCTWQLQVDSFLSELFMSATCLSTESSISISSIWSIPPALLWCVRQTLAQVSHCLSCRLPHQWWHNPLIQLVQRTAVPISLILRYRCLLLLVSAICAANFLVMGQCIGIGGSLSQTAFFFRQGSFVYCTRVRRSSDYNPIKSRIHKSSFLDLNPTTQNSGKIPLLPISSRQNTNLQMWRKERLLPKLHWTQQQTLSLNHSLSLPLPLSLSLALSAPFFGLWVTEKRCQRKRESKTYKFSTSFESWRNPHPIMPKLVIWDSM